MPFYQTERVEYVMTMAADEARQRAARYVEIEHLFLVLLRQSDAPGSQELLSLGVDLKRLEAEVEKALGQRQSNSSQSGQIDFSSEVRGLVERAAEEARFLGDKYIGTEHLLLGLLLDGGDVITRTIQSIGLDGVTLVEQMRELLGQRTKTTSAEGGMFFEMSPRVKKMLPLASQEASRLGCTAIEPEHLLMGILRDEASAASAALLEKGITLEWLQEKFKR